MSVAAYNLSILYNTRVIDDLDFKINAVDNRILNILNKVHNGQMDVTEGHLAETTLLVQKHKMESERESRKTILERNEKDMKDTVKKSFTLNVSA